ncbi:hypothetical protein Tco_0057899 [Tanacetum coccineum]
MGSNQGRSTKRRRSDSAASGSAKPPLKANDQSSMKPMESDASASKQHPALTSTGWQITDTRDAGADSSMHRSDPESEHSEQSSDDISKQDEGNGHRLWNTMTTAHIPKSLSMASLPGGLGEGISIINKHSESSDREAVRLQMRILSVISILEKDFKNLHPNDFEDLFLLNIQEKLNHLPKTDKTSLHTAVNMWIRNLVIRNRVGDLQLGIESYQTKINLERLNWDAADYYFKEDYTIVPKPRAVDILKMEMEIPVPELHAQDGNPLQDDVRLCLGDDLKKAQDHCQRQAIYHTLIISLEEIQLDDKLNFVEEPVEIMDREVKQLKRSRIPIIKVRWNTRRGPEYTWECEDQFKSKYPTYLKIPRLPKTVLDFVGLNLHSGEACNI